MKILKLIMVAVIFAATITSQAQTIILSSQVPTYSTATEGDFYKDENDRVYIGMSNGSLVALGDNSISTLNVYDATGGQSITNTPSKINLDTSVVNIGGYTLNAGDITIADDGIYEIGYSVDFQLTNGGANAHEEVRSELFIDGVNVSGSRTDVSLSTTAGGDQSASRNIIVNLVAGNVLSIWSVKNGTRNVVTIAQGCGITIKKLE